MSEKSPSLNSICDTCKRRVITIQVCYDCVKERDNKLRNQTLAENDKIWIERLKEHEVKWDSKWLEDAEELIKIAEKIKSRVERIKNLKEKI